MRREMRYLPVDLCMRLPRDAAQTYYILSDEEKDLFEEYYRPFIILPDIPPDIPYHILRIIITQPISKKYLEHIEKQRALS